MIPTKHVQITKEVLITIDDMANWFWMLEAHEQVKFFNSVAAQATDWYDTNVTALKVLAPISEHKDLTPEALEILRVLAPSPNPHN